MNNGALNPELAAQLWLYVEGLNVKPANIIISGGPGSGKTTLLNALFSFIPAKERIVVIEDTLELNTDLEENCSRLESDEETTLADLVKNSLRMRPDRVIVGEVRGREAQDLMTAMNIGKYCMGTLHASTPRETVMRLENEPMNIPNALINLIDVFVVMRRFKVDGQIKRVVGELAETGGMERDTVLLGSLWSYDLPKHEFLEPGGGGTYRDRLAQISGRSSRELVEELKRRVKLVNALSEKGITDIQQVTRFCRKYTSSPEQAIAELGLKSKDL